MPAPWENKDSFKWDVTKKNTKFMQEEFESAISNAITTDSAYKVVKQEEEAVLAIDVAMISFTPYVSRENSEAVTKGNGHIRMSIQLRDGRTGKLLYMYEGFGEMGQEYQPNTDMARKATTKTVFKAWGENLRKAIDAAHGK